MIRRLGALFAVLLIGLLGLAAVSCAPRMSDIVTPTPDYAALEALTEERLAARLTAQAPWPTETPTLTPTPLTPLAPPGESAPDVTPTPTATPVPPVLVHVRKVENDITNIVAPSEGGGDDSILTYFPEPLSITALTWSKDGTWLAFASSHAFFRSRQYERNLFLMRPDGSELRMVTGEYMDPADAPGPYVELSGVVENGSGLCTVYAQGATNPVETDASQGYAYTLIGVSQAATWARAICQDGEATYQGDVDLNLAQTSQGIAIPVTATGQGWRDVSMAPDGVRLVSTLYQWERDEQGARTYTVRGALLNLETGELAWLEIPEGKSFQGADWSFDGERIVGGLADEEGAYLWQWDPLGKSVGSLVTLENPEDEYLTIVRPRWSPRETGIAFELHRWYWWGDPRFRTDLMLLKPGEETPTALVTSEWGQHATHASWAATGMVVFYQRQSVEGDIGPGLPAQADIWLVSLQDAASAPWTDDGASYLPAARPR